MKKSLTLSCVFSALLLSSCVSTDQRGNKWLVLNARGDRALPLPPDPIRDLFLDAVSGEKKAEPAACRGQQTPARAVAAQPVTTTTRTTRTIEGYSVLTADERAAVANQTVPAAWSAPTPQVPQPVQSFKKGELPLPPPGYMFSSRRMPDGTYEFRAALGPVKKISAKEYLDIRDGFAEEQWPLYEYP